MELQWYSAWDAFFVDLLHFPLYVEIDIYVVLVFNGGSMFPRKYIYRIRVKLRAFRFPRIPIRLIPVTRNTYSHDVRIVDKVIIHRLPRILSAYLLSYVEYLNCYYLQHVLSYTCSPK